MPTLPCFCGLSASLLFNNDDRDVDDVWLSHWLKVSNEQIGPSNVINFSIVVTEK